MYEINCCDFNLRSFLERSAAKCPKNLSKSVDSIVILLDGLMTAELKLRLLERSVGKTIQNRCERKMFSYSTRTTNLLLKTCKMPQKLQKNSQKKLKMTALAIVLAEGKAS